MCEHLYIMVSVKGSLTESILSFQHVSPEIKLKLSDLALDPLNSLACPGPVLLTHKKICLTIQAPRLMLLRASAAANTHSGGS